MPKATRYILKELPNINFLTPFNFNLKWYKFHQFFPLATFVVTCTCFLAMGLAVVTTSSSLEVPNLFKAFEGLFPFVNY